MSTSNPGLAVASTNLITEATVVRLSDTEAANPSPATLANLTRFYQNGANGQFMQSNGTSLLPVGSVVYPSGTIGVGNVLTATLAVGWTATGYQWYRTPQGGTPTAISGATASTYTQSSADVYNTITVSAAGLTNVSAGRLVPLIGSPYYLGQVGAHSTVPTTKAFQFRLTKAYVTLEDNVTSFQIALPNYYLLSTTMAETAPGGIATYTAAIEYPIGSGTLTQVKWSGATSTTAPDGGVTPLSDPILLTIPGGDRFAVQHFNSHAVPGGTVANTGGNAPDVGEITRISGTTFADQTMVNSASWSVGSVDPGTSCRPVLVVAQTQKPSVFVIGDSIVEYLNDTYSAVINPGFLARSGDQGLPGRILGARFGYLKNALQGRQPSDFITGPHTNALAYAQYFSHVWNEMGVNGLGGVSAAVMLTQLQTIQSYFPNNKFIQSTITPRTSSTDNWQTTTNQTPTQPNATNTIALNQMIRAGAMGNALILDLADYFMSSRDSGLFAVNGSVGGYTADGVHPSPLFAANAVTLGVLPAGLITR